MDFEELDRLGKSMELLRNGDFTAEVKPEDSIGGKQLAELQKLREDFDQYRADYAADKEVQEKHTKIAERESTLRDRTDRIRFWVTFGVTLVGSLAAVGSLIATIVLN